MTINLRSPGGLTPLWVVKMPQYATVQLDTRQALFPGDNLEFLNPVGHMTWLITGYDLDEHG